MEENGRLPGSGKLNGERKISSTGSSSGLAVTFVLDLHVICTLLNTVG